MNEPYRSPETVEGMPPTRSRPGSLTTLAVLAIVLGVMGMMSALFQGAGLILAPIMQSTMQEAAKDNPEMNAQVEIQRIAGEQTKRFMWFQILSVIVVPVISILLLAGGIQALRLAANGRRLLLLAFTAALIFELLRFGPTLWMQFEGLKMQSQIVSSMQQDNMDEKQKQVMEVAAKVGGYGVIAFTVAWFVMKIGLFFYGRSRLNKTDIRGLFNENGQEPLTAELM